MTDIKKKARRRARHPYYRNRIVVMLEPSDGLVVFRAPIAAVYRQLVLWDIEAKLREKRRKPRKAA